MQRTRLLLSILLSILLLAGQTLVFITVAEAAGSRGFSSGRSSYRSSGYSKPTHGTWDRSGGGLYGSNKQSSSGYSKPGLGGKPGGSGYTKPSLPGTPSREPSTGATQRTSGSSGYAKPSLPGSTTPSEARPGSPQGGYAKPTASAIPKEKFSGGSQFDKTKVDQLKKQRSQESLRSYRAEQNKFKKPEEAADPSMYSSNPLYQKGQVYGDFNYRSHYQNRDQYYRAQNYQPPAYAFGGSPSFGMFDALFLYWMLDHASNRNVAATAYHHADDPGYKKWRQEVEGLAKDNQDLKSKLAELDKQTKTLEGTPKDAGYLPKGVPTDAALAASVLATKKPEKPVVRFAGGQGGGWYDQFGAFFRKAAEGLDVKLIRTEGSLQNLKMLSDGKADLAIVQSDVLAMVDKQLPGKDFVSEQTVLYPEFVQLIANRSSGIKAIKDIDPKKHVLYVGPKESGTALTWDGLREQDPKLKEIPTKTASYTDALLEVRKNPNALMMFVGGLNSPLLKKAEEEAVRTGKLRLVAVRDPHFKNLLDKHGNPIYKLVEIPKNVYPSLQKGWFFSGNVHTLAVQAVLVLRTEWAKQYSTAMDALSLAVQEARPEIQRLVNSTEARTGFDVSPAGGFFEHRSARPENRLVGIAQ
jgi:TRAP transporter TAXI family solute receptor